MNAGQKVVIVGAGINGLVAANYLQRNGFSVTILEKAASSGGACATDTIALEGKTFQYANGASVLGMMQDFVFKETGLSEALEVYSPRHPSIVHFEGSADPCFMYEDTSALVKELESRWNERGDVKGFLRDLGRVSEYLSEGFKRAVVPTIEEASNELGNEIVERWICGSAANLLNSYFTSDSLKVFYAIDVVESGPVSLYSPYSAFNIPLMASGTIFGGDWGFVKGRMWKLAQTLATINESLGIETLAPAEVISVNKADLSVEYDSGGGQQIIRADNLIFATDPVSAAHLVAEPDLIDRLNKAETLGTSGKLVMFFRKPVIWKSVSDLRDHDMAFRFVITARTLEDLERGSISVAKSGIDYVPGFAEIYCEGAGMRHFEEDVDYDVLSIFFKNLSLNKPGVELPQVKKSLEDSILAYVANRDDFIDSVLFTPRDLQSRFGFPGGNIDHVELCEGQTFFWRNYSPVPQERFYQFGFDERIFYCAAGSYPCGSIAGTAGYMCAKQLVRSRMLV